MVGHLFSLGVSGISRNEGKRLYIVSVYASCDPEEVEKSKSKSDSAVNGDLVLYVTDEEQLAYDVSFAPLGSLEVVPVLC
jgi:hypothetical protein